MKNRSTWMINPNERSTPSLHQRLSPDSRENLERITTKYGREEMDPLYYDPNINNPHNVPRHARVLEGNLQHTTTGVLAPHQSKAVKVSLIDTPPVNQEEYEALKTKDDTELQYNIKWRNAAEEQTVRADQHRARGTNAFTTRMTLANSTDKPRVYVMGEVVGQLRTTSIKPKKTSPRKDRKPEGSSDEEEQRRHRARVRENSNRKPRYAELTLSPDRYDGANRPSCSGIGRYAD